MWREAGDMFALGTFSRKALTRAPEGGGLGTCCPCTLPFALLWVLCAQEAPSSALRLPACSNAGHCQPYQESASIRGEFLRSDRGMPFGNL